MATDATGTPTPLGIPTFNTAGDPPTGKGFNASMQAIDTLIGARATLASPAFTGTPTAPTQAGTDNSTALATTAFVKAVFASAADKSSASDQLFSGGGAIGYGAGAGGAVTQVGSNSAGVTINKVTGQITLVSGTFPVGGVVTFLVTNSKVQPGDVIVLSWGPAVGNAVLLPLWVAGISSGSFVIAYGSGSGNGTPPGPINFAVIKGSAS